MAITQRIDNPENAKSNDGSAEDQQTYPNRTGAIFIVILAAAYQTQRYKDKGGQEG